MNELGMPTGGNQRKVCRVLGMIRIKRSDKRRWEECITWFITLITYHKETRLTLTHIQWRFPQNGKEIQ